MSSSGERTGAVGRSSDAVEQASNAEQDVAQTPVSRAESFKKGLFSRLNFVGSKFNILDRLFNKRNGTMGLQYGANADGVFSNLTAKPDQNNEAEVHEQDKPPNYEDAALDMAPSYCGMDEDNAGMYYNEICFEGLPVGNIVNLLWNIIVSVSFQFVGFLLTYILHTSHAAKQGSRFGLGLTFLGYGYSMIPNDVTSKVGKSKTLHRLKPLNPNEYDDIQYSNNGEKDSYESNLSHGINEEWTGIPFLTFLMFASGAFIMAKSIYDYVKVKRKEKRYLTQEQV
ncbi:LANO_0D05358g1_1 [Lachancea nothofagi CBS 11611]|uniref:LANO_0D05358g1_1 n=1 Tax=Lachancea nothofagi CBS 11611 TaxID=1266666 RepID=A0A1G4JHJ7_9SACH|nr:LANO_0D05358g1_1 [Lachancea nothofagi CBS 11611]